MEQEQEKRGRGGARKGAGRPKGSGAGASERVIFRLTPAQLATLTAAARPGESAGEAARRLLLELLGNIEGANP